jgi:hypothetical protein
MINVIDQVTIIAFMIIILREMGHELKDSDFALVESIVGGVVFILCGALAFVKNNKVLPFFFIMLQLFFQLALHINMLLIAAGSIMLGVVTIIYRRFPAVQNALSPVALMTLNGIGLYLAFVPYQGKFVMSLNFSKYMER